MIILVSDTSILNDLERGGLLEHSLSCGLTLVVHNLLYSRELEQHNGAYLKTLGLGVVPLTPDEVSIAQSIRGQCPALSLPDCFSLTCAMRPAHELVTGYQALFKEAYTRIGNAHGLLWLLDQIALSNTVPFAQLLTGLKQIIEYPRCRLPAEEVKVRLRGWGQDGIAS